MNRQFTKEKIQMSDQCLTRKVLQPQKVIKEIF